MRSREDGWRWCQRCQGMFRSSPTAESPTPGGVCPAGPGPHDGSLSGMYGLQVDEDGLPGYQQGWSLCTYCHGLWLTGWGGWGVCPARTGGHDASGSQAYVLVGEPLGRGQADWRFCAKCMGMFFAGHSDGVCPATGAHDLSRSGTYVIPMPFRCDFRSDPDGYGFSNDWVLDDTETNVLAAAAAAALPFAGLILGTLVGPLGLLGVAVGVAILEVRIRTAPIEYGLCGGMAFSSLDYHRANQLLPRGGSAQPTRDSPPGEALRSFIWQRLLDSVASSGATFIVRKLQLKVVPEFFGGGAPALSDWTREEVAQIVSELQIGSPVPLGLIGESFNPLDDHQVLAYGFELEDADRTALFVYDNKVPDSESAFLFDFSTRPYLVVLTVSRTGPEGTLRGVFRVSYVSTTTMPPALEAVVPGVQSPSVVSNPGGHSVFVPVATIRCVGFGPTAALAPVVSVNEIGGRSFPVPDISDPTLLVPMMTGDERTTGPLFELPNAPGVSEVDVTLAVSIGRDGLLNNIRVVPPSAGAPSTVQITV